MSLPPSDDPNADPYRAPSSSAETEHPGYAGDFLGPGNMVRQIPILSGLMIAQGILVIIMGLFLCFAMFMPMILADQMAAQGAPPAVVSPVYLMVVYGLLGALALIGGIVTIMAGVKMLDFRGRKWGFTALGLCIASVFTCYCAPTGIALAVYAFILLLNPQVVEAFRQREQGQSKVEVLGRFY